ncbi:MAG TPA: PH domain-containing protein [Anaerolineales bacterium]|nr:PH domain-containing protein [Anaerolineales bacterium]
MLNTKVGHFPPAKRLGLIVHGILILALAGISTWGFVNLTRTQMGPTFVNYLLAGILAFAPIPFLGYRAYALLRADYYIDRDSLAMLWGLRVEDIPLTDVEWVRPASDLTHPLSLPRLRLPGAVLGTRRHPDLGLIEFIASDPRNLILVATAKRVFAISPKDANSLIRTFARAIEMGSLLPAEPKSVYPSFVVVQAWNSPLVRFMWVSGLLLNIGLVTWVGLLIPSLGQISLGFSPFGAPQEAVPSIRLLLLPLLSGLFFITGWLTGLYFYRWDMQRMLANIIWISSTLSAVLFLMAVLFIVSAPV